MWRDWNSGMSLVRMDKGIADRQMWWFLKKLKVKLPLDPAISLLGIYPKGLKAGTQAVTCTHACSGTFTMVRGWKQPACPGTDE